MAIELDHELPSVGVVITNLMGRVHRDVEAKLKEGGCYAQHAAWNFCGAVWYADGMFHEEVWVHQRKSGTHSAETLDELMEIVNDQYGRE